jgi:hypothetical protein
MVLRYFASFPWKRWLWLWLGLTAFMVTSRLVAGDTQGVFFWLAQIGFWLLLSFIAVPRRYLAIIFFLALLVLSLGGGLQRWLFANTWRNAAGENTNLALNAITLEGGNERAAMRTWRLTEGSNRLQISLETRLLSGQPGLAWYGENTQALTENGKTFLRWQSLPDTTLSRRYVVAEPLGGKEVLLRLTLQSSQGGCGRVRLAERVSKARNVSEICLTNTPQTFEQVWTVPSDVTGTLLNITLTNFSVPVDILAASLELDGTPLSLPAPSGVALGVAWRGNAQTPAELRFLPDENWHTHQLEVSVPAGVSQLTTYVQLEPGVAVELRDLQVRSTDGSPDPEPLSGLARQTLGTPHANLAGHALATTALALLALSPPLVLAGAGLLLAAFGIALTGSRTAFLSLPIFGTLLLLLDSKRRWLGYVVLGLGLLLSAFVLVPRFERLMFLDLESFDRPQIWSFAFRVMLDNLWSGVDVSTFKALALEQGLGTETGGVDHAHNLWLAWGSSYGILGFLGSLYFTFGLLRIAWLTRCWPALIFIIAIVAMNIFDNSLSYVLVVIPVIATLNSSSIESRVIPIPKISL